MRTDRDRPLAPRGLRTLRPTVLAAAIFAALPALMLYPLSTNLATHLTDDGDSLLNIWILGWVARAAFRDPANLFHGNIYYPFPYSLAFSELLIGGVPIAAPVTWLTGNPVAGHNALLLATFALCGFCTYLLVERLTGDHVAGVVAGIIFAYVPFRFAELGHVQILVSFYIPLAFVFLHLAIAERRRPALAGLGACFVLQALSSFYFGLFLACALGLWCLVHLVRHRDASGRAAVVWVLATLALSSLLILPFALPYFRVSATYGVVRTLPEVEALAGLPSDYLAATDNNLIWGAMTEPARQHRSGRSEHILFPGALASVLMLVGLVTAGGMGARGGLGRGYFGLLAAFAAVMTLGPHWKAGGPLADLPMPYLALYELVPGFKGIRAPTRFHVLVAFSIAVLAGHGVCQARAQMKRSPGRAALAGPGTALLALAVLAEYAAFGFPLVAMPAAGAVPSAYRWLAEQDERTVVLELPAEKWSDLYYVYFSTYHWRRLVNGWSGLVPPAYAELARELESFPAPGSVELVRRIGVDVVLVHPERYSARRWREVERRLASADGLTLVGRFGGDLAYRVEKPASPAGAIGAPPSSLGLAGSGPR